MDCVATLATFPVESVVQSVLARKEGRAAMPLLSVLVLLRGGRGGRGRGDGDGDGAGGGDGGGGGGSGGGGVGRGGRGGGGDCVEAAIRRLLPTLRALSASDTTGESQSTTLALLGECDLNDETGAALDAIAVKRGCLTCTWSSVWQRHKLPQAMHEPENVWAGRIFKEVTCYSVSINPALVEQVRLPSLLVRGSVVPFCPSCFSFGCRI
eukprot:6187066-Pleurochrysis_carterae.AAC.1